ncbi:putative vitellogenin receptor [Anoplophora glabripennis]|uniref:putative vitellogenin receptor n=1 Tax=Anoplophora glabripennis TaxID=217634 RepID=UPI00087477DA|nr:putative vitellogenin receptor [Anoplophora glabripennis]
MYKRMVTVILLLVVVATTSAFLDSLWEFSKNNCTANQFACRNGNCVPTSLRCNENNDCGDGSDEDSCDLILCKEPVFFRCKNKRCISKSFVCDGEDDCGDFSDELKCSGQISKPVTCEKSQWQCTDKKLCIPKDFVCNGEVDCADHSDEGIGCTSKIVCDGFKCNNGHCIPKEWICDGHNDCNDKSDEQDCEHHFDIQKCNMDEHKFLCSDNKTCIDLHMTCNGHNDCLDKSDEGPMCSLKTSCAEHNCSHECVQLPSGPTCRCPTGYHNIDEKNCKDINECERYGVCDQKCKNTPGSYECYCDSMYTLQPDKRTCKAEGGEALMIFSSKTEIRGYTLQSELYYSVAKRLKQVVGVDYDGHHIYWTDIFAEHESIVRSIEDGSDKELLVTSGLGLPEDLAVDWLTGNIYFTDVEKQHIGVCTSTGDHCTVLLNKDIRKPRGIVLNVELGDMYWTDWGKPAEIAYALMDGTNDRPFVSEDIHWPNGLALDYPNERLYWTDARKMSLESIRLDGTDRRIVLEGIVKHPYAIAVFENNLYWSDWATHSIQSCDKFFGKRHHTIIKDSKEYIYGISIFHSALHARNDNPCDRAFCSDICLLKGKEYTCACPQNKILAFDRHLCREVKKRQMLILGYKDVLIQVEHQLLGKHDVTTLTSSAKNIGCLAFDSITNSLLISDLDTKTIISTNLNTGISETLDVHGFGKITAMEFDPMANNLYMCDEKKAIVEVVNLNTMSRKILLHDMHGEIPEAIALVPEEGVMFVSLRKVGGQSAHIDRLAMDGSGRTHIVEQGLLGPVSVHYDSDVHRVFFADAGTGNIESTSVEGDDRHGFRSLSTYPIGLTTLHYDIFWVNEHSKRLYWAEKNASTNYNKKITLDIPSNIEKLHLVSVTPKKQHFSSCLRNNGGCSHLCLMSHKSIVCACPVGWDLSSNNHTCIKREHCKDTEYLCYDSNTCILKSLRCNGHNDCSFGEDEKDCKPARKCPPDLFECSNGECIKQEKVCDYNYDCKDKSDEHNCKDKSKQKSCPPQHFSCGDGQCIVERFLCDGVYDCEDHSDEVKCSTNECGINQFRCNSGACIPKSWECDHDYDCNDFSDEHAQCGNCPPTMYTCLNGKCIDKQLMCDNMDDCGDNSDEYTCNVASTGNCSVEEFACSSNTSICVLNSAKCNGTSECPHHEDEKGCSDCNIDEFNCKNKKCIPVQWICDGIDDCGDNTDEKTELCSHAVGVTSSVVHISCEHGFRCKSGHCIALSSVCDGKHDCYDDSDEDGLCSTACDGIKHPCSQVCVPTPTGPMCKCNPGYKLMGDGHTCEDLNECRIDPPVCSQLCNNNEGSYICDCFNGYLLRSDKKSCKAEGQPMSLIFTSDNQIRSLTQKTNSLSIIYSNEMPEISGLDFVLKSKSVYFSIEMTSTIHRINQETQVRQYIEHVGQPQKISVDWTSQNVYFYNASSEAKSISVCNFEEMLCAKLIDIDIHRQVSAIAIDSLNKVMFYSVTSWWVLNSPSYIIYKCNLDGSGKVELVKFDKGYVTDLTFDFNSKHLYFIDQHKAEISMVNYEGKLKTLLFTAEARPVGLKFFENYLFYLTSGGYLFKCKLFEDRHCENFKLHGYSSNFFTIAQDSLQPRLENVCKNHSCSYLCLPSESQYKCLCSDGKIISKSEKCSGKQLESVGDGRKFKVHSVSVKQEQQNKKNTSVIVLGILLPILIILVVATVIIILRKKNSGGFNVSIRFHNSDSTSKTHTDEKPLLKPGQHEYTNPVHFGGDYPDISASNLAKKLNEMGAV